MGGLFLTIAGQPRACIAALDPVSGAATSWRADAAIEPSSIIVDCNVTALATGNQKVYVGGTFGMAGMKPRNYIAAIDTKHNTLLPWNPDCNAVVSALAVGPSVVYVGGGYTHIRWAEIGSRSRAVDRATGLATAWDANLAGGTVYVQGLTLSGSTLYVGGVFGTVGGQAHANMAAVDASTAVPTAWNPPAPNSEVDAFYVDETGVYVVGRFTALGGTPRTGIAALDPVSGAVRAGWRPDPNTGVFAIVALGSQLYFGGPFQSAGGQPRNRAAAVNKLSGALTGWTGGTGNVEYALAGEGSTIYLAGGNNFGIAARDTSTGAALPWNPQVQGVVSAVALRSPRIYVGGQFARVKGSQSSMAGYDRSRPRRVFGGGSRGRSRDRRSRCRVAHAEHSQPGPQDDLDPVRAGWIATRLAAGSRPDGPVGQRAPFDHALLTAGPHEWSMDVSSLPGGVYFYPLTVANQNHHATHDRHALKPAKEPATYRDLHRSWITAMPLLIALSLIAVIGVADASFAQTTDLDLPCADGPDPCRRRRRRRALRGWCVHADRSLHGIFGGDHDLVTGDPVGSCRSHRATTSPRWRRMVRRLVRRRTVL